jgi:hypothetical protein
MKVYAAVILLIGIVSLSDPASAILVDRGTGMIYDTDQGITWLQDSDYYRTSGYCDGRPPFGGGYGSHYDVMRWVGQLEYGGYDDWRLPSTVDQPVVLNGINLSGPHYDVDSELAYMYHVNLGNDGVLSNTGPFLSLGEDGVSFNRYWSETPSVLNQYGMPWSYWSFDFNTGASFTQDPADNALRAWAVRDGDTGPAASLDSPYLMTMLLGQTVSFDYWREMGTESTDREFDVLLFNGTEWEIYGGEFNLAGSAGPWETASFSVPEWARGLETQIMVRVPDFGQEDDPAIYLRNIASNTSPVPEPAAIILLATGLLGIAGASRKRCKKN